MRFETLQDWLSWQESLHPSLIDLGLERVSQVFTRLHADFKPPFTVITVAGTNGKGSSIALLEAILLAAGYRVGTYTSPHLLRYNERIRINGEQASDAAICQAFQRIDTARGETSLTYFEFGTLAALDIFYRSPPDIVLLEVGLGGRLDAVNIVDADIALITAIGLDHTDWLGTDREAIATEKAGVMRVAHPVVCSDEDTPRAIQAHAEALQAPLYCLGRDFGHEPANGQWQWWSRALQRHGLPKPALPGVHQLNNASGVLMVLELLADRFPTTAAHVREGLRAMRLRGRYEQRTDGVLQILDVAHNVDSAVALANVLRASGRTGESHAVVGMLADKDTRGVLQALLPLVDVWHCADLTLPRGATAAQLAAELRALDGNATIHTHASVFAAWQAALRACGKNTGHRIIAFGSFYTVAELLARGV